MLILYSVWYSKTVHYYQTIVCPLLQRSIQMHNMTDNALSSQLSLTAAIRSYTTYYSVCAIALSTTIHWMMPPLHGLIRTGSPHCCGLKAAHTQHFSTCTGASPQRKSLSQPWRGSSCLQTQSSPHHVHWWGSLHLLVVLCISVVLESNIWI